jgi:hypothetical protein
MTGSCQDCWNHICTCGTQYKNLSSTDLKHKIKEMEKAIVIMKSMLYDAQEKESSWDEPGRR